jgi:hypothetical protein
MYRVKIEQFTELTEQTGYKKEVEKSDVYEQVFETVDVQQVARFLNDNPGVAE